jgi:fermentation-respiration switch protein FrsA (DUF1100 family)
MIDAWQRDPPQVFAVHGEGDAQIRVADARKFYEAAGSARKQLKSLTAAEGGIARCQLDNLHMAYYYMFDWLADVLEARQ